MADIKDENVRTEAEGEGEQEEDKSLQQKRDTRPVEGEASSEATEEAPAEGQESQGV